MKSVTATAAQVTWKPVNISYVHGSVQGYKISYRAVSDLTWSIVTCGSSCTSIVVDHLESMTTYRFRIQSFTHKGNGIAGDAAYLQMPALGMYNDIWVQKG